MQMIRRTFVGVAVAAMLGWTIPAMTQANATKGELIRVDTTAKTISIRAEGNAPMVFAYSETTKVTGAGDSVAALSTMPGSSVTIHFTKGTPNNMATHVEVEPAPAR